ncbi:MAG: DUF4209 domain-containing protein [Sphingorhabdus sp.]
MALLFQHTRGANLRAILWHGASRHQWTQQTHALL